MDVLNSNNLATFQELMEPAELRDFLHCVHEEVWRAAQQIAQANGSQDWAGLQKLAHRLKGSLGSVGCDRLYSELHRLEMQLQATPPQPPTASQMSELADTMALTAQHLHSF